MAKLGPVVEGLEVGQAYKLVVPQKLALGGKVSGKRQPGLFRVYVPGRDGLELTLEASAGQIELTDPSGQPARDAKGQAVAKAKKVQLEVPLGTYGWYGLVVTGAASYDITAKAKIAGHSRDRDGQMLVPWHFYYFPFTQVERGHPADNWDKRFGTNAYGYEATSFFQSQIDSGNRQGGGYKGHCITKEFVKAYNDFAGKEVIDYDNCWWWGHCDAAASASAMFTQPRQSGSLAESDLEWAATEIAMRGYDLELKFFLGGLTNSSRNHPSHKDIPRPEEGQALDKDIGPLHETLVKVIKNEGAICISDLRAEYEEGKDHSPDVWNQAVYKFEMELEQAETDGPGKDEDALARKLKVQTTIFANADTSNSSGNPESPGGSGWNRELTYILHYDKTGKVNADHPQNNAMKCTWQKTGKQYYMPRYMFKVKGLGAKTGSGNPKVELAHLKQCGVKLRGLFGG